MRAEYARQRDHSPGQLESGKNAGQLGQWSRQDIGHNEVVFLVGCDFRQPDIDRSFQAVELGVATRRRERLRLDIDRGCVFGAELQSRQRKDSRARTIVEHTNAGWHLALEPFQA